MAEFSVVVVVPRLHKKIIWGGQAGGGSAGEIHGFLIDGGVRPSREESCRAQSREYALHAEQA
jgi:hypothetical protein